MILPMRRKRCARQRANIEGYQKQLNAAYKDIAELNLTAPYAGKLLETVKLTVGDEVGASEGRHARGRHADAPHAVLQLRLSRASFTPARPCRSPIPALMSSIDGRVEKVHMVKRVTSEGSELFSVEIVVPNAGVLAKDMAASATVVVNGETVYPYEAGKLRLLPHERAEHSRPARSLRRI